MIGPATIVVNALPNPPVSGGDRTICSYQTIPALTVTVGAGETADWFTAAVGGTQVAAGTLTYTPATAGTWYVESRNSTTGCASATRTAVSLTINPEPMVAASPATQSVCPGASISNINITNPNNVAGTSYTWNRNNAVILTGIPASGNGTPISGTLNSTMPNTLQTTTFTINAIANGCTSTVPATVSVTVGDVTLPLISCPVSGAQNVTTNLACTYLHTGTGWNATATDNCSVSSVNYTLTGATTGSGTSLHNVAFNIGTTTVTWRATDAAGNMVSCSFSVVVADDDLPVINCTSNKIVNTTTNFCTYNHSGTGWNATATDNCTTIASLTYTLSGATTGSGNSLNGVAFNQGLTTVTWTATDAAGNSVQCSFTVTVTDNQLPAVVCPSNQTRAANTGGCNYTVVGNEFDPVSFSDNCPGAFIVNNFNNLSTLAGAVLPQGNTNITWRVTAANGQFTICTFTVTISDNQGPVIVNCPSNLTVYTGPGRTTCDQVASWTEPTASDNCGGSVTWTRSHIPGSVFPVGTTLVTYTASDGSGNSSSCSFNVTVVDNTPPTFTIEPNVANVFLTANCTYSALPSITGDVTNEFDNCQPTGLQATYSDLSVAGACPGEYVITRTWLLLDNHGNSTSKIQTINVLDKLPPALIAPANITVSCQNGTLPAATGNATASDNCSGPVTITYSDVLIQDPNCIYSGTITRTWTATDCAGNISTGIQTITIADNEPPTGVISNITVACPENIPLPDPASVLAFDNCGVDRVEFDYEVGSFIPGLSGYCPDYVTRYYKIYDVCGNVATVSQLIDVLGPCGCSDCTPATPLYTVDLMGQPSGTIIIPNVHRNGRCCDNNNNCVAFNIRLDPAAVGLQITVSGGAAPGPMDWRVDCEGVTIGVGNIICIPGGVFHLFTYCKPGNNPNDFTFISLAGVLTVDDVNARKGCSTQLFSNATSNVTWTSVSPGNPGDYDNLLSCTNCPNPFFTPLPTSPTSIQYQVCGAVANSPCIGTGGYGCDVLTVTVYPPMAVVIQPDPMSFCNPSIPTFTATVTPSGNYYTIEWYNAYNAGGTVVGTGYTYKPLTPGFYSVKVIDLRPGIPCSTYIHNFEVAPDDQSPVVTPPANLILECNDPNNNLAIQNWLLQATAIDDHTANPVITNNFTGLNNGCGAITTVTWSATDQCSNVGVATATITLNDTQIPTWISTPGSLNRTIECSDAAALAAAQALAPAATDLCDPATLVLTKTSGSFVAGSCPQAGTYTNTWTAKDLCGNVSAVYTQVITITDHTAPVWTTVAGSLNRNIDCDDFAALAAAQALMPVATDNCDGTLAPVKTAGTLVQGSCANAGSYTNTFVVTDDCGNTSNTFTQIITIYDPNGPALNQPATNLTVECDGSGNSTELNNWLNNHGGAVATDECGPVSWTHNFASLSDNCGATGSATVIFTATDACNNFITTQATFTIVDTQAPNITCPADVTAQINTVNCTVEGVVLGTATATDACSATGEIVITNNAPTAFPAGITIVTWTATDACGNSATCQQTVTVEDLMPPTVECPVNVSVNADPGVCQANVTVPAPNVTDPCPYTMTNDYTGTANASGIYPVGITTVNWTITGISNNTFQCTQTITVVDTQAPSITCPVDQLFTAPTPDCELIVTTIPNPVLADNCDVADLDLTWAATGATLGSGTGSVNGTTFNVGVTTVTYTVTDAAGNFATCTFTVTINDEVPPTIITCPADITVDAEPDICSADIIVPEPVVDDPCGEIVSVINSFTGTSDASGTYNVGTTLVIWTITDASGNTTTCTQTIVVEDNQLPTISCPGDVLLQATPPDCEIPNVTLPTPTYSDNCANPVLSWVATGVTPGSGTGFVSITTFNVGNTVIAYTITDASGNTASCSFNVVVNDDVPPTVVTCPENVTENADAGSCETYVDVPAPDVYDPCGEIVSVTHNSTYGISPVDASGTYPVGIHNITWTFTDESGNTSTCSQIITVIDNQFPTLTCPPNVTAIATPPLCEVPDIVPGLPTYGDNCPNPVLTWLATGATTGSGTGFVSLTTFNVGTTTITYTVTDASNNVTSCSFTVIVNDVVPPTVITCPDDISVVVPVGFCEVDLTVPSPVVDDPCQEIVTITHDSPYGISPSNASGRYPVGVYNITWTFTDESGNESYCYQEIEVIDDQNPVFTFCPDNVLAQATPPDCEVPNVILDIPTFSDNCPDPVLTWEATGVTAGSGNGFVNITTFNVGTTIITYTITDASGNTAICTFNVVVNDDVPPTVVTCPENVTENADAGLCETYITVPAPDVYDPCGEIVSVTHNSPYGISPVDASGTYPVGIHNITWTFTDESGNVSTCPQTITVTDDQLPVIDCPDDVTAIATPPLCTVPAIVVGNPVYSDNCPDPELTWTKTGATIGTGTGLVNNTTFNVGVTTVTYTVTDASGNTANCLFTVTINDQVPPTVITCPADETVNAPADACEAYVASDQPEVLDPCGEIVTWSHNSSYGISSTDASGTYPVGVHTVTWTFEDASGNEITCEQIITVVDVTPPALTCPPDFSVPADFGEPFASDVPIPAPMYSDACDVEFLSWVMTGATNGSSAPPPPDIQVTLVQTLNVGTTTFTYTAIDFYGNVSTCEFDVTVLSEPEIDCPVAISVNTDPGVCSATLNPGQPTLISGAEPITWTYTITNESGTVIGTGTCTTATLPTCLGSFDFPVGINTITWTATNISGVDECVQTITVTDNEAPEFTAPGPFDFCVINIISAQYDGAPEPAADIIPINPADGNPRRPDWYLVANGSTELDLTDVSDNCCALGDIDIEWTITFDPLIGGTLSGSGQPSISTPIQLWGIQSNVEVNHTITYTVTDCNGNLAPAVTRNILIRPRPHVIKNY